MGKNFEITGEYAAMRWGLPGTPQSAPTREWCYGRQNITVSRIAYALVSGQIAHFIICLALGKSQTLQENFC